MLAQIKKLPRGPPSPFPFPENVWGGGPRGNFFTWTEIPLRRWFTHSETNIRPLPSYPTPSPWAPLIYPIYFINIAPIVPEHTYNFFLLSPQSLQHRNTNKLGMQHP